MNFVRICSSSPAPSCRSICHLKFQFVDHSSLNHFHYLGNHSYRFISTNFSKLCSHTHYNVLGLKSNCSQEEIRLAYLELCKKYHPDRTKQNLNDQSENKLKFQQINDAYRNLNSPGKRAQYDTSLRHRHTTVRYSSMDTPYYYRPSASHQYNHHYNNNDSFHHYYEYRNPFNQQNSRYRKVKIDRFTATFSAAIFISLIIVLMLQSINNIIELQMFEEQTKRRYKTIAELYYKQHSLNKKRLDFLFVEEQNDKSSRNTTATTTNTSELPD